MLRRCVLIGNENALLMVLVLIWIMDGEECTEREIVLSNKVE